MRFDTEGAHLLRVFSVDRAGNAEAVRTSTVAWHRQPADGTYRVRARVLDKAGNATASDPRVVRVDNTPPEVTEITAGDGDGKVEAGDGLVVSFSERLDPGSLPPAGRLTFGRTMARGDDHPPPRRQRRAGRHRHPGVGPARHLDHL